MPAFDATRGIRHLATPEGDASPQLVVGAGIGTRVRLVFKNADGLAVPLWTVDESAQQPAPWRYPDS